MSDSELAPVSDDGYAESDYLINRPVQSVVIWEDGARAHTQTIIQLGSSSVYDWVCCQAELPNLSAPN